MSIRIGSRLGALRVAPSSLRALPSFACSTRKYATSTGLPFACTWLTKTPEAISTHDVLSSLPATPLAKNSVPLLLVTPRFAHWLDPSDQFLPSLMQQLYGSDPNINSLYTVAAVIDKIPHTSRPNEGLPENGRKSSAGVEGEGVSLLVVDKQNVHGKAVPPRRFGGPANEEPDLSISILSGPSGQSLTKAAYEVGLRLANTVFVNGKESTIFGMRWYRDASTNAFTLHTTIDLASCAVTAKVASASIKPHLKLPLYPIGVRRRVIASMGNILRQISKSTDPTSSEPIPASSQLEKDLPQYIKENNIVDHRVSVWALVEKPDAKSPGLGSTADDYLVQSLQRGAKLHRVVSGGGGWGKKQGLLSLDPEVNFSGSACREKLVSLDQLFNPIADAETDLPSFLAKGLVGDDLSLLSQVASAGDFIQFFVSVDPASMHSAAPDGANTSEGNIRYNFGMVSNAEELSSLDTLDGNEKIVVLPNSFGALSEKAIAYSQPVAQGGRPLDSSTKLDIPGCRVILGTV